MFLKHLSALQLANYHEAKQTQKDITKGTMDSIRLQGKWDDEEIALLSSDTWKVECVSQLLRSSVMQKPHAVHRHGNMRLSSHTVPDSLLYVFPWLSFCCDSFWTVTPFSFLPLNFLPWKVQIMVLLWPARGANKHSIAKLGQSWIVKYQDWVLVKANMYVLIHWD